MPIKIDLDSKKKKKETKIKKPLRFSPCNRIFLSLG